MSRPFYGQDAHLVCVINMLRGVVALEPGEKTGAESVFSRDQVTYCGPRTHFRRNALLSTKTEDSAIAAAASTGDSCSAKTG